MSGLINKNKCNLKTIMFNLKKMSINAQCAMNFPKLLRILFFLWIGTYLQLLIITDFQ